VLADAFYAIVLIAALDATSFRVREDATARLERMGDRAAIYLQLTVPRSPEQRQRIDRLIQRCRPAAVARMLGRFPALPGILHLPRDFRLGQNSAVYLAGCFVADAGWVDCEDGGNDPEETARQQLAAERKATGLLVRDLDCRGWSVASIEKLLQEMAALERIGQTVYSD
jgi:hypothetical protein